MWPRTPSASNGSSARRKSSPALNHPHICTLYEFDNHEGTDFLVMEYLEGETLADRLQNGALPLDQALRYAIEIADALDKAHRQGVTHRDLKPANIMLTKAGAKLLDFGLAKLKPTGPQSDASTRLDESLTEQGTILGTFQYMAPEQLEGKDADARTDIWAFGCVVYEMVTGQKAFEGKSQASLIGSIMTGDPRPIASLQPMSPPMLDQVIRICLAKDPDERWQGAGDIGRQLKYATDGSVTQDAVAAPTAVATRPAGWRQALPFALGVSLFVAVITGLAVWGLMRPGPSEPSSVSRFVVTTPSEGQLRTTNSHSDVAISPDGMRFVYTSGTGGTGGSLYVRHVDQLNATFLRGTEDGQTPFFSPDGEWVGFTGQQDRILKRVSILGGPAVTIADTSPVPRGLSWGHDDHIVFATGASRGLLRVPAVGGEVEQLTTVDPEQGETDHWWPDVLPNGKGVLFTAWSGSDEGSRLAVVSLETREVTYLLPGGSHPRYSPTGHIVYGVGGTLRAVGFDTDRLELTSSNPVPVVENVMTKGTGAASFSVGEQRIARLRDGCGSGQQPAAHAGLGRPRGTRGAPRDWAAHLHQPAYFTGWDSGCARRSGPGVRHLDLGLHSGDVDPPDFRSSGGQLSGLDTGWAASGVCFGSGRGTASVLESGRRDRLSGATRGGREWPAVASVLARWRTVGVSGESS